MWNKRYSGDDYLFGTEPADFMHRALPYLDRGARVLSVADGEGRNSVWLAGQGMRLTALDGAMRAVEKARALAALRGVTVDFHLTDIDDWDWDAEPYDAVLAVFVQFVGPADRTVQFARLKRALRPGGLILLHGYAPRQVDYGTGGPPFRENMYTTEMLTREFAGYDVLRLEDFDADVDEGRGHSGKSALVDLIARKPAG